MKRFDKARMIPLLAAALLVAGAAFYDRAEAENAPLRLEDAQLFISQDRVLAQGLEEMTGLAQWVGAGRYIDFVDTWNISRDPDDPQQPDEQHYTEGRLYRFQIETVYKGQPEEDEILVSHRYSQQKSMRLADSSGKLAEEPTVFAVTDPLYQEPVLGENYILFLNQGALGYYHAPAQPFQIRFDADDRAQLCTPLTEDDQPFLQRIEAGEQSLVAAVSVGTGFADTVTGLTREEAVSQILQYSGE